MFGMNNKSAVVVNTGAVYTAKYVVNKAMVLLNDQRAYITDAEYKSAVAEISAIKVADVNNSAAVRALAAKWNIDIDMVARINRM
jgi:hypothetical protein